MDRQTQAGALLALVMVIGACGGERHEGTSVERGEAPPVKTQVVGGDPDGGGYRQPFLRLVDFKAPSDVGPLQAGEDAGTGATDAGPVEDGTFDALTRHTIRWESHGIEAVRLDVSLNEGMTWDYLSPEAERIPAHLGAFTFTVPARWDPGQQRPVRFRVADADKPGSYSATSSRPGMVRCCDTLVVTEARQGLHSTPGGDFQNPALPVVEPRGAFVEIVSRSRFPVDLTGFRLAHGLTGWTAYTFPAAILPPGGVALVWGGPEAPPAVPGNVLVFVTPTPETLVRVKATTWGPVSPGNAWNVLPPLGATSGWGTPVWQSTAGAGVAMTIPAGEDPTITGHHSGRFTWSSETGGRYIASPGYRADGWPYGTPLDAAPLSVVSPQGGVTHGRVAPHSDCDRYGGSWEMCGGGELPGYEGSTTFQVQGGAPPYRFELEQDASAPPGVVVSIPPFQPSGGDSVRIRAHGNFRWADATRPDGTAVTVTLRVTDSSPFPKRIRVPVAFNVAGYAVPMVISQTTLPVARVGQLYETAIDTTFPSPSVRWTVTEDALPPGVRVLPETLLGTGVRLGGMPTKAGTYAVTVAASWEGWDASIEAVRTWHTSRTLTLTVEQ